MNEQRFKHFLRFFITFLVIIGIVLLSYLLWKEYQRDTIFVEGVVVVD